MISSDKKVLFTIFACLFLFVDTGAQHKASANKFTLSQSVPEEYIPGKVLVKVKSEYQSLFQAGKKSRQSSVHKHVNHVRSLAPVASSKQKSYGRALAYKPVIDMSLYYEISFDAAQPVEQFINELYESGYIEIAEPVYRQQMMFTPNDPEAGVQYYLETIKAYEAWEITQGSEEIVIAIVDSGGDLDHPDLASQLYINTADPVNGIDDDLNGYVDDYRGWDFSGASAAAASAPDFIGDNDPSVYKGGNGFTHGTAVASCASAATNNGIGMAGVGFKTKLLFTKHFSDDQSMAYYSSDPYKGVLYAANQGARIINCSWGSTAQSEIYQAIITHVTQDLGCLVVGAAGNSDSEVPIYPASYNYVFSVAATDINDNRSSFSSYGHAVDIAAPGTGIYIAAYDNTYMTDQGTSFSAPIVCGAAALVWSQHPEYTPMQVAAQLRVTADESLYDQNPTFTYKLGRGRLNIYNALTQAPPAIRALKAMLVNESGTLPLPGQNGYLSFDFINDLHASSPGLVISIAETSSYVTLTKEIVSPGAVAAGAVFDNKLSPFELTLDERIPENYEIEFLVTYADGDYYDYQYIYVPVNPTFFNIDDNLVTTTLSGTGRVGFYDTQNQRGKGFVFNGRSMLYEMGLMMGTSSSSILNSVRGINGNYDQDFVSLDRIQEIIPGERSYSEIFGSFSTSETPSEQNVMVSYRSLVWQESPYDNFIILEYKIKNPQAVVLSNFYLGLFADWDISANGVNDAAGWDAENQLGYAYPKQSTELPYAGIQLLTANPLYFAIDNDQTLAGNPFGIYDGFTDDEKFTSLSTFTKTAAGNVVAAGNDVSHVVSSGPYTILQNEEITIAFALHAADNLAALKTSAKYADSLYNFTLQAPQAIASDIAVCYDTSATFTAGGASAFKWYTGFTGGAPVATGTEFTVPHVKKDTVFYVSNAEHTYESVRTKVRASVVTPVTPGISASGVTTFCEGGMVTLAAGEADEYLWSNGLMTQTIGVSLSGDYRVMVKKDYGAAVCGSVSDVITVNVLQNPVAGFSEQGSGTAAVGLQFLDESIDAVDWFWDFGDNGSSEEQNPVHIYQEAGAYDVKLTVTATNGCQHTITQPLSVITGTEDEQDRFVNVYPVPSVQQELVITIEGSLHMLKMVLADTQGKQIVEKEFQNTSSPFSYVLKTSNLSAGLYYLSLHLEDRVVTRKIIINP